MSDEAQPKKKTSRNHLTVMQSHAMIEEMKAEGTQALIDERRFNKVSYAAYLSAKLGYRVTRGNLWEVAEQLKLRFHHPMNGVFPGNKRQPTFDDVMAPVGRHELVELRVELRNLATDVGRAQSRAADVSELREDVRVYGQNTHSVTVRVGEQEQRFADRLIEVLGKVGMLDTRVVRQADRLSEALKQIEDLKKFLEGQFNVAIPSG